MTSLNKCEAKKYGLIAKLIDIQSEKLIPKPKNAKERLHNENIRREQEEFLCALNKKGEPIPSLPGKRILDNRTFNRLKNLSVVVPLEEKRRIAQERVENEERRKYESQNRKAELQKYDTFKSKGPKLAHLDEEANRKSSYLLNRAFELRQNQEDEIRQCNSLILSTKCHAIRSAQIVEKELIQKEKRDEDRRMIEYMEQQRMLAAKRYEKQVEIERLKKANEALEIVKQMKENEILREWELAKASEDARLRIEASIEAQRAEVRDHKEKLITQARMRKEFLQINAQLRDMKRMEKDLIKLEILQIQEYDRKKNEREMAYEEDMKKQKYLKEKEIAKIQASQKASQDLQAAKDELNALRVQDKVEKEWRQKEKEAALNKIKTNEDLKEARRIQIEGQRASNAFEIQREKDEFDKIIRLNAEDIEKTKELDRQNKMNIDKHRKNLLEQINSKEMERIRERKMFFQEGVKYQEETDARNRALRGTMLKKVEELKTHKLPAKYISGIERQLKLKE